MSIDIGPIGQTQSASPAQSAAASSQTAPDVEQTDADQQAVSVDTFPTAPPPQLSGAIAVAARAYDNLQASGRRLHFAIDAPTGRLTIELHDLSGSVLATVKPSQALGAACGEQLS